MCKEGEKPPEGTRYPHEMGITVSLCHGLSLARRFGWTIAIDNRQCCYVAGISMGFFPFLPDVADGSYQASIGLSGWTQEQAAAIIQSAPRFDYKKYEYLLAAPLSSAAFEPDIIVIYANPAQMWILLSGYLSLFGKNKIDITLASASGCTLYITKAIQTNELQFGLVDGGERLQTNPQDSECVLSVPVDKIEKMLHGIETRALNRGYRYPIPSFLQYSSQQPPGYDKMAEHLREGIK
jgi:uncharacterized protein (DUF169 family)